MKKKKALFLLMVSMILLLTVACSNEVQDDVSGEPALPAAEVIRQNNAEASGTDAEGVAQTRNYLDVNSTNLMMTTFQLESTEYAVTAEQAAELLPLWKVYQSLIESSTTAEVEREALLNQISGLMTDDQLAYLASGEIDPAEMSAVMEELGIEMQDAGMGRFGEGGGEELTDAQREEMQALRETMGGGEGGSGGGFGGGMGQDMDPEQLATLQAERAVNGGGARGGQMDTLLIPALIELLEAKL